MTEAPRCQPMIVIRTPADHITHDHEIRAYCPHCLHSHDLNLAAMVASAGDMTPDQLRARLRCGKCNRRGGMRLTITSAATNDMRPHN